VKIIILNIVLILFIATFLFAGGGDWEPPQQQEYFPPQQQVAPNAPIVPIVIKSSEGTSIWWTALAAPIIVAYITIRMQSKKNKKV